MSDKLLEVFSEVLGLAVADLTEETSPDNTSEWDSLAAMNLVSLIEDTFDVHLSTKEIMKMRSIAIVREVLKAKDAEGL